MQRAIKLRSVPFARKHWIQFLHKRGSSFFDKSNRDWETAWSQHNTPWETGATTGALQGCVESRLCSGKLSPDASVLIPGCGSGFDIIYLKKVGMQHVTAIEISSTALEIAENNICGKLGTTHPASIGVELIQANFFSYRTTKKFDFIYDHLFFSAIELSARIGWAISMKRLISSSGVLATLIFPHFDPTRDDSDSLLVGPPYPVRVEDYMEVLTPLSFKVESIEQVRLTIVLVCSNISRNIVIRSQIQSSRDEEGRY